MQPEDKARAIVAAATTLFSRYGFKRTSVDDIAREARIAKGTVYLYYPTKDAVFGAVCEAVCERIVAEATRAAKARGSLVERLSKVLTAKYATTLALVDSSPHAAELMDSSSSNALGAEAIARAEGRVLGLVRDLLAEASARGEIELGVVGLDADAAAALVLRSAVGAASRGPDGALPSGAEHARRLRRLSEVLVRGFAPTAPAKGAGARARRARR